MKTRQPFLTFALTLVAASVWSKPVLWFHFDEKAPGTKAVSGVAGAVVNAADPGSLDGTIRGLQWNSTTMNDNRYVYYTNTLDEAWTWTDPVTGWKGNQTGIYIDNLYANAASHGGLVTVPDDEKLHLTKFTTEFFCRMRPDSTFRNQSLLLQLFNSAGNTFAWSIRAAATCEQFLVYCGPRAGGNAVGMSCPVTPSFNDYRWHHLALTYDGTTMKFYYDYALIAKQAMTVEYATDPSDAILAIGNNPRSTWGRYHGFIDEFRISDEALTPEKFLRPRRVLFPGDEDTLVYIGKDTLDFGGLTGLSDWNEIGGQAVVPTAIVGGGRLPTQTDASTADAVRADLYATNVFADTASLFFETNAAAANPGRTARLAMNDIVDGQHALLTNDELTVEFFVKPSPQAADKSKDTKYLLGCHTAGGGHYVSIFENANRPAYHEKFQARLFDAERGYEDFVSPTSARDGNWHHIALAQDRPRREVYFYVDYRLEHVFTNFVMEASVHTNSYFKEFNFGAAYANGVSTSYRGHLDEFRITRRALQPTEFLSTREIPATLKVADGNVLFYAPLDADLKAYPCTNEMIGVVSKGAGVLDAANRPLETIAARATMGLPEANAAAFVATEGALTYDDALTLAGAQSMTIEFYANVPDASGWIPLVRYENDANSWLQVCKSSTGQLAVMLLTDKTVYGRHDYIYFDTTKPKSRRWHHYAVTLEKKTAAGETVTEVRAWVDHVELGLAAGGLATRQVSGEIPSRIVTPKLYLGRALTWASLTGALDEVRITEGVLDVADFLDACPKLGAILFVR